MSLPGLSSAHVEREEGRERRGHRNRMRERKRERERERENSGVSCYKDTNPI
jgi:hypothetical protein